MTNDAQRLLRVFVNAIGVDVSPGSSVLDAVRIGSESEAAAVSRGEKLVTDSRGLPISADEPVSAGSIFRVVPVRKRATANDRDNGAADADTGLEDA